MPCPFCGSSTDGISNQPYPRDRQGTSWIAACGHPECHAEIEHATADRAIAAWNTRTSPKLDKLEAEVERLKAGIIFEGVSLNNPDMAYLNNILKAKLAGDK